MESVNDDFYEDDEPIADVIAAFGPGPHMVTSAPRVDAALLTTFACSQVVPVTPFGGLSLSAIMPTGVNQLIPVTR